MNEMNELEHTWLVQRLNKAAMPSPFAFGGGGSGLSKEATQAFSNLFSFDYMGSAEFEFGIVGKTFKEMNDNIKDFSCDEVVVNKTPLYIIGRTEDMALIKERIKELSKRNSTVKGSRSLKEPTHLDWALGLDKYSKKENCRTIGWLELNNQFIFFLDKEIRDNLYKIFVEP